MRARMWSASGGTLARVPSSSAPHSDTRHAVPTASRLALVGVVALALGVLTAYAQDWLPPEVGSLANSSGSWALVAFVLALATSDARIAAFAGCLTLLALLAGYRLAAAGRGFASGTALIVVWGLRHW